MKKICSIALLCIFLLNVGGYYAVYFVWHYTAAVHMAERLDNEHYSANETITIKIPFNLPYQSENVGFRRMNGEFQYNGEFFKLVKQKVENDTLYVVCIKDHKEKEISNFVANIVKSSTEQSPSSTVKLLNSLIKDYVSANSVAIVSLRGWFLDYSFASRSFDLLINCFPVLSPPPDSIT